jgi:hypothetical protein
MRYRINDMSANTAVNSCSSGGRLSAIEDGTKLSSIM